MSDHASGADFRTRIRPLPADTPDEVFVPFVDLCFNWSMDRPRVSRDELAARPDARHYFTGWGRPGDLAVACVGEDDEEIIGLAWLRLADAEEAIDIAAQPRDVAFSAGLHAVSGGGATTASAGDGANTGGTAASAGDGTVGVDDAGVDVDADEHADGTASVGDGTSTDGTATSAGDGTSTDGTASADDPSSDTDAPFAGYGWVAADIPELSIAVLPAHQGQGIGRALIEALLALARMTGVGAVSLAVEDGNGAKNLYADLGFASVGRNGDSDLMVRRLT